MVKRICSGLATIAIMLALIPLHAQAQGGVRAVDRNGDKVFDALEASMRGKAPSEKLDVIALFSGGNSKDQSEAAQAAVGTFSTSYLYETIPAVAARMTSGQIRSLAARSDTVQIQLDAQVDLMLASATESFGSDKAELDFGVDGNNENGACPGLKNYCADDVVVAVLDSGISNGHVDLDNGKVIKYTDCTADPCWMGGVDTDGHGTHVASIIAGEGDGDPANKGVAPGAALVSVKIATSITTVSWMDRGIEWTIQNRAQYGIDALNLSAGTSVTSDGTETTSRLINQAAASGIVPFVAAGNSGTKGPQQVGSPAAAKFGVTVGAMTDPGGTGAYERPGFNLWHSSSRGPTLDGRIKPDVVAPGVAILAAGGGSGTSYISKTGTSMASPFAAGVGALMLDANPSLVPTGTSCLATDTSTECADGVIDSTMTSGLKDLMKNSAVDWGPAGPDIHYGSGRLDAYAAVEAASPAEGSGGPAVPVHTFTEGSLAATGAVANHVIPVTGTRWPVSITFVTPSAYCGQGCVNPDFNVSLLDPSGAVVATSPLSNFWQETIGHLPTVTGNYTLRVTSAAGAGSYWFDASYPGPEPEPAPTAPPAAPTGLRAAPVTGSATQLDLAWDDVTTESGYKVERSATATGPWAQGGATFTDVVTFRDSGLAPSTTYYYRVVATNAAGSSGPSNTASAKTNADTIAPSTPTNVKAAAGKAKITLTWSASTDSGGSGLAGYRILRSTASTGVYTQIGTTTTTSYVDTAVTKGKVYWYYLVAYDRAGNTSVPSAKVSAKPT